ncbi:HK97 gp10 family phage protein [Sphingomonas sp. RRHST34]|uniref:HK97 gp10 family phage protein n=1 Tax=Sphingomonas citri TaxID=2862499 RepID=A0ABS7BQN5_9SPHN|nr:HK97 gp10 family phage protein [Sphingomonas citri]MBW6531924.1 HK97 gp10 family phage protein [Sphingomonas citri]
MVTVRGKEDVARFLAQAPTLLEERVLRGAARAGMAVIANEARDRVASNDVREALVVTSKAEPGRVTSRLSVKPGWARSVATWLEYGTSPHYISVDDSQRGGRSAARINRLAKSGTLVIGGQPVGSTVFHPGARPHPFMRVSLDTKEREAIAAAQSYINSRVSRSGIAGAAESDA